jgi:hypothetical protein
MYMSGFTLKHERSYSLFAMANILKPARATTPAGKIKN